MASSREFMEFVLEQFEAALKACGLNGRYSVSSRKMFGEYCVYLHNNLGEKATMCLVCDDIVYIKKFEALHELLSSNPCGLPYTGAKEWYIIDIDSATKLESIFEILPSVLEFKVKKSVN